MVVFDFGAKESDDVPYGSEVHAAYVLLWGNFSDWFLKNYRSTGSGDCDIRVRPAS
jgi:hypothetical protein